MVPTATDMATDKRLKRFRSRYRRSNISEKTNSKEDKEIAGNVKRSS